MLFAVHVLRFCSGLRVFFCTSSNCPGCDTAFSRWFAWFVHVTFLRVCCVQHRRCTTVYVWFCTRFAVFTRFSSPSRLRVRFSQNNPLVAFSFHGLVHVFTPHCTRFTVCAQFGSRFWLRLPAICRFMVRTPRSFGSSFHFLLFRWPLRSRYTVGSRLRVHFVHTRFAAALLGLVYVYSVYTTNALFPLLPRQFTHQRLHALRTLTPIAHSQERFAFTHTLTTIDTGLLVLPRLPLWFCFISARFAKHFACRSTQFVLVLVYAFYAQQLTFLRFPLLRLGLQRILRLRCVLFYPHFYFVWLVTRLLPLVRSWPHHFILTLHACSVQHARHCAAPTGCCTLIRFAFY